jgi:TetR/AcrR family transcriptional regulator, mexJK operon transcriptional repressor
MTCPTPPNLLTCAQMALSEPMGAESVAPRSPGRPKDAEKLSAILDASMDLFAKRGLEGVPVEAIAAAAGVSKVTVYANFKCKSEILAAIVARHNAKLGDLGNEIMRSDGTLAERLARLGHDLVDMITEPSHRALDICLGQEAQRNPELAKQFFDSGPGHLRKLIAEMLQHAADAGEINVDCAITASEDLLGLWLGFSIIEKRFQSGPPQIERLTARIDRGVRLFLRAYAAEPTAV